MLKILWCTVKLCDAQVVVGLSWARWSPCVDIHQLLHQQDVVWLCLLILYQIGSLVSNTLTLLSADPLYSFVIISAVLLLLMGSAVILRLDLLTRYQLLPLFSSIKILLVVSSTVGLMHLLAREPSLCLCREAATVFPVLPNYKCHAYIHSKSRGSSIA